MSNEAEITQRFWKALKSDRTVMLGLTGVEEGHSQPMTAVFEEADQQRGVFYIFSARDVDLVRSMGLGHKAMAHFSSKGHDLFATVHGVLVPDNDRAAIDRLWSPFAAAWYEHGKDDPKLQLLRFDAEHAQVWLNENSLFAGVKSLLGRDPTRDYKDKVAEVRL